MEGSVSRSASEALVRYRKLERDSFESSDPAIFERFSEDMVLISTATPTLEGRNAISQHFQSVWKTHKTRFVEIVDEDVQQVDDTLIVTGRFTLAVSELGSKDEALSEGRYLAIFKPSADGEYELWKEVVTDSEPRATE